jgi:methionyl-tRNA formyltransferase
VISIIFFGSFQHYSVQVLDRLHQSPRFKISAIITTPPRPGNRGQITPTPVFSYAQTHRLPLFPLENLDQIPPVERPDFIIVAGFGRLLDKQWLNFPKTMALNLHPSLLPAYPGRFPAEWAILRDETQTGVTLIKMSAKFDAGDIVTQKSIPILPTDTRSTLYHQLYDLGAKLIIQTLSRPITSRPQPAGKFFYARQLSRDDGFLAWDKFIDPASRLLLDKMIRALHPWPGVWTLTPKNKRLKIISLNPTTIQLEGKKPTLFTSPLRFG